MLLHALDGVLFVLIADWLSVAFRLLGLWALFKAVRAQRQINRAARATA